MMICVGLSLSEEGKIVFEHDFLDEFVSLIKRIIYSLFDFMKMIVNWKEDDIVRRWIIILNEKKKVEFSLL